MPAARIVGVGGGDDSHDAAFAVVADDHLAMVRLEVEQPGPRAESNPVGARVERVRKIGFSRTVSRPPPHGQAPEGGVDRIGIPQAVEIGRHHLDARAAQRREVARWEAAVHVIDGVGDHQDAHLRHFALAFQQRVAQLDGQLAMRRRSESRTALSIEQEEIEDEIFVRLADQADHGVEDLLAHHRGAEDIGAGHVIEELELVERCLDDGSANPDAVRQRFVQIPQSGQRPQREKTVEKQPSQAPLSSRHRLWGRRIDRCLVRPFSHSGILAAPTAPTSVSRAVPLRG